ncbi:hypothetical protein [Pantoea ananatis]|uniref:hypothetical protein n=1 Tax=Pantoea ananas TaxID=553 RepID=UPI000D5DA87B|nr:hypothetical protein [Pantoea ananatis]MCV3299273.1 hypothetical protein [Pantoea ananatis]PVY81910.1 hypothetical protein C7427_11517 [Pantoea ananatis]
MIDFILKIKHLIPKCKLLMLQVLAIFSLTLCTQYVYADSASNTFTCHSGKPCIMKLQSQYQGHTIMPDYKYDITATKNGDISVEKNSVSAKITYTYGDQTASYADITNLPLDGLKHSYALQNAPDTSKEVKKLSESVSALFTNESSESKSVSINIRHNYGENDDTFTYNVNVLPPPPVCTTTISDANLDMGTYTTSQLAELSPGQSAGVTKSVKVFSQCSYSSGINISLSTNKVASSGYLVAGGGLGFLPDIDGKSTLFGSDGKFSFNANSDNHSFDLGFTAIRSDEKPSAGNFSNIITVTTTPL